MTAQYLFADGFTGSPPNGSYVYKTLNYPTGITTPIYLGADIYFCSELIDELSNDPTFPFINNTWLLFGLFNLYGSWGELTPPVAGSDYFVFDGPEGPYLAENPPSNPWVTDWESGGLAGTMSPGLHTIQFHADVGAQIFEYRVDGVVYPQTYEPSYMDSLFDEIDALVAGWGGGTGSFAPNVTNLTNFTAGTTGWGSTDIFFDDFSSGDLSAWDGFVGNCSVVATPTCPPQPPPPPPPTITSSPYFALVCNAYYPIVGTSFTFATQLSFSDAGPLASYLWFVSDDEHIFFNSSFGLGYPTVTTPFGSATSTTYYWGCGHAASGHSFDASVGFRAET